MTAVLVTYASKHGATLQIAKVIAHRLTERGIDVEACRTSKVDSLDKYDAVVLGSAVYMGQWMGDAVEFVKRFDVELQKRPVWIFSSGPTGEGDPVELLQRWRYPDALESTIKRIGPRDIVVFHGNIDTQNIGLPARLLLKVMKAKTGDYRQWASILIWAQGIAEALQSEKVMLR